MRRRVRSDRGAAATLVAVLLAGGVLLGMTALVVDVGQLYAEREELQSTADSTAMAVALDCAFDREGCDEAHLEAVGAHYAEGNVRDNLADVFVCGNDERLPDCDDPQFDPRGNLTDCLGERPEGGIAYVEVRTSTLKAGGSTLLPPSFAQTLVSGHEGTTVGACARVAWGSPGVGLALTISHCEWDNATTDGDGGRDYAPKPPPHPHPDYERVIKLHNTQDPECEFPTPGQYGPGGFGWLMNEDCQVEFLEEEGEGEESELWYRTGTGVGADVPMDCRSVLEHAREHKIVLTIPVFDKTRGTGANLEFRLHDTAALVVTGYNNPGMPPASSNLPGSTIEECSGPDHCVYGYFVDDVGSGELGPLPGELGLIAVRTVG